MSINIENVKKGSELCNTPRDSIVAGAIKSSIIENKGLLRHSLNISKQNDADKDRSMNVSQNTDRMRTSPRVLNSQKNSPRHSTSQHTGKELRQSMYAANSYLDIPYQSLGECSSFKTSTAFTGRRRTLNKTAVEINFSNEQKKGLAFNFYKMPNYHFLSYFIKRKQFVPSPDKYEVCGNMNMSDLKKRVFSKLPRLTMAAEILKNGTLTPGPGSYRLNYVKRNKEDHKMTLERELGFINEAKYKGSENPLNFDSKFNLVEEKPRFTNFRLSTVERSTRIDKKPGLSPFSYEPLVSFKKTQLCIRTAGFSKSKIPNFSDVAAKKKNFVPSPGQYDIDKPETKVYKPFHRKRR